VHFPKLAQDLIFLRQLNIPLIHHPSLHISLLDFVLFYLFSAFQDVEGMRSQPTEWMNVGTCALEPGAGGFNARSATKKI
jgi:hypothetical protein